MTALKHLLRNTTGATMVEYGIMLALIALVCLAIVTSLGSSTHGLFTPVVNTWNSV